MEGRCIGQMYGERAEEDQDSSRLRAGCHKTGYENEIINACQLDFNQNQKEEGQALREERARDVFGGRLDGAVEGRDRSMGRSRSSSCGESRGEGGPGAPCAQEERLNDVDRRVRASIPGGRPEEETRAVEERSHSEGERREPRQARGGRLGDRQRGARSAESRTGTGSGPRRSWNWKVRSSRTNDMRAELSRRSAAAGEGFK
ncbi:hypothetical protein WMY93_005873 [Mugilogobius chulae]|uniref:Uncharacterized protein n=1 Tax=Mugilogobius chulae TaxID=88201 RepID=A0AAW0PXL2_9GOBI